MERTSMMGQRSGKQDRLFYSFNLNDHVPADHMLRSIDRYLDLADLHHHRRRRRLTNRIASPRLGSCIHCNPSLEKPSGKELIANGASTSMYQRVTTHCPLHFSSSVLQ